MASTQNDVTSFKSDHKEQSSDWLDVGLPRHGFVGSSATSLESVAFQRALRSHVPGLPSVRDDLEPITPDEWMLVKLTNLTVDVQFEVCRLARALQQNARELTERYEESHPRSLGDSPRFVVVALFEDGKTSSCFYNLPPLTRYNRCAEQGLVSDLVTRLSRGERLSPIKSIILVGLASCDGKLIFRIHPNFCSPCRTSLAELIPLGLIDPKTEVLSFSISLNQEIPQLGRRTTFGNVVRSQVIDVSPEEEPYFSSPNSCIQEVCSMVKDHFGGTPTRQEMKLLSQHLGKLLPKGLSTEPRSMLIARRVKDGKLLSYTFKGSRNGDLMTDGTAHYASASTVATLSCLASRPGIEKPIVIDLLPLLRLGDGRNKSSRYLSPYNSVVNQRRLDLLHHESMKTGHLTRFLQVFLKDGRYRLRELNPVSEQPLAEGILYRGRTNLLTRTEIKGTLRVPRPSPELQFSSQLVYCTKAAARMAGSSDPQLHGNRSSHRLNKRLISEATRNFSVNEHDDSLCRFCSPSLNGHGKPLDYKGYFFNEGRTRHLIKHSMQKPSPYSEYNQKVSQLLQRLLEGASRLNRENALQKIRVQQPVAAYAIGVTSEGEEVEIVSAPGLALFTDSSHPNSLFNLCVELVTRSITPKEIHVGKRSSFTLAGPGYSDLLKLLTSEPEADFPLYIHTYQVSKKREHPDSNSLLHMGQVRRYSAREIVFPLR